VRYAWSGVVVVELPPVVEIVPSTVPFETVQVEVTVRVPPPGRVHVPVKPVSSSAVRFPRRECRSRTEAAGGVGDRVAAGEQVDPEGLRRGGTR
jgi:hypothetical protein